MGTLNKGMTIEFTSETLLRMFRRMTLDERVTKKRFQDGLFANVYERGQGCSAIRFVVLWDDGSNEPFLFKLRSIGSSWEVVSINETCANHTFQEGMVLHKHVKYAADVFYASERERKKQERAVPLQPQPAIRPAF